VIGYYVHHQGRGHLHRALAVAGELDEPVTMLSSLAAPAGFTGEWVLLARDDEGPPVQDPTAGGRLHWAPTGDPGLRHRMHQIARWLDLARPRLLVVDVSVEVAVLARLHGVPIVSVVLPGHRADPAHRLGFDLADELVAAWPPAATPSMLPGLPAEVTDRVHAVGGLARFPVPAQGEPAQHPGARRVVVLGGAGGSELTESELADAERSAPGWEWTLCGPLRRWCADPFDLVRTADVVVTHAGQNAVAEVAAARRPAVVVAQPRPHDEQAVAAAALRSGDWPAVVLDSFPRHEWSSILARAVTLDGSRWAGWCDGDAARRFADLVAATASGARVA
jgi:hypothetical protein